MLAEPIHRWGCSRRRRQLTQRGTQISAGRTFRPLVPCPDGREDPLPKSGSSKLSRPSLHLKSERSESSRQVHWTPPIAGILLTPSSAHGGLPRAGSGGERTALLRQSLGGLRFRTWAVEATCQPVECLVDATRGAVNVPRLGDDFGVTDELDEFARS